MLFQWWRSERSGERRGTCRGHAAGTAGCRWGAGERLPKNQSHRGCAAPWFLQLQKGWQSALEAGLERDENGNGLGF